MNIAMLSLKYRQNKNQKQRILLFVGSPIRSTKEEMGLLGKKLKKNAVAVDIISYGNVDENKEILDHFLSIVNNNNNSHLQEVRLGYMIADALFGSAILNAEDMDMNMGGGMVNLGPNQGGPANPQQNNPGQNPSRNTFEDEMEVAIRESIRIQEELDRKKIAEAQAQSINNNIKQGENNQNQNQTNPGQDIEMTNANLNMGEEIDDEEALLEEAKRLSCIENEKVVKEKKDKEGKSN